MDRLESMSILLTAVEAGSLSAAARQLGHAARDRQPQGLGARSAPQDAAAQPVEPATHVDRCGPILCRGLQAHSRRRGRSRACSIRRIQRAERRSHHHRADRLRPPARPAGRDGIPQGLSGDRRPTGARRIASSTSWKTMSISPFGSASYPTAALIATRVGTIRRVVCGSPAYFAAHGTPKHPC